MMTISITGEEYRSILNAAYNGHSWILGFTTQGDKVLAAKGIKGHATGATQSGEKYELCYTVDPRGKRA